MEKLPETNNKSEELTEGREMLASRGDKTLNATKVAGETSINESQAVSIVHDHFPEDISPKEHFERDFEPSPLQTEEDYKKIFDLFLQEELIPVEEKKGGGYKFVLDYRPYKETVQAYRLKTEKTIRVLAGEDGKLPKTDVAIYLDKSARPVSWLVDEFWEDVTDKEKPRTEHLAIDRKAWFEHFDVELGAGEYKKDTSELATWRDLPINKVTKEEVMELRQFLKNKTVTHEGIREIIKNPTSSLRQDIEKRVVQAYLEEMDVKGKIDRGEIKTNAELEPYLKAGKARAKIFDNEKIKGVYDAFTIATKLRGLFVPGGLSEEDLKNSERIMDYPTGMDGKNITIIDEVERSGATRDIAKHFISWAFPEAANVEFYAFYDAKKFSSPGSPQDGQMLMIPFWYPLSHDDGTGRGIGGSRESFYEERFKEKPDNLRRAAKFGWKFLGVPIDYETEKDKKSLRLREQIARLRVESEKGHIV